MAAIYGLAIDVVQDIFDKLHSIPPQYLLLGFVTTLISILASVTIRMTFFLTCPQLYLALHLFAPVPRPPLPSEKKYQTILPDGEISEPLDLPCWYDSWRAKKEAASTSPANGSAKSQTHLDDPEIFVSVVVPAYNEQDRLGGMLEEAVAFLQSKYGDAYGPDVEKRRPSVSSQERSSATNLKALNGTTSNPPTTATSTPGRAKGWEILIISDGSTDQTVQTALKFTRDHQLNQYPVPQPGPWTPSPKHSAQTSHQIPHGSIRVVTLAANRGKGGAVTHGLRHTRGQFVVFADADGASRFEDLEHLIDAARKVKDGKGRAIAIGSRAHLVGSDVVVKRSALRNALMRSFHLFIRILTPPATSRIRDTQCGFKLFTREALPDIVPYMHMEGWIFDVEMLMLGESAGIPMSEVPVGWKEVLGSKLNVVWDSVGMAVGLAVLRGGWGVGVYRR